MKCARYTKQQLAFLRRCYKRMDLPTLTTAFNERFGTDRTDKQIRSTLRNHRMQSGRTGQFEKGGKPWNTGTHFKAGGRSARTRFKKGNRPHGTLPIGSERAIKGGYIQVKVAEPSAWRMKHHLAYEQHHGPIPPGHVVTFRDLDPTNCDPANLEAISCGENAIRNKLNIRGLPDAARPAIKTLTQLYQHRRQLTLLDDAPTMKKGAILSDCRNYRYELSRYWDHTLPIMMVVGLNPSTADETHDDPTIRRVINFAKAWGYGGIRMNNLFAWRATNPKEMLAQANPIGEHNGAQNDAHLTHNAIICGFILVCWGEFGDRMGRDKTVLRILRDCKPVHCLGVTKSGQPRHPLYIKGDVRPMLYTPPKRPRG